ncbi:MAG: hypothetical protein ACOCVZ_01735 [Gemmatimonadota bacterium]
MVRIASSREGAPALRLLAALLVTLQLAGPVVGVLADSAPTPAAHHDHIGGPEDPGCRAFHDEVVCLSSRVVLTGPVRAVSSVLPLPTIAIAVERGEAAERPLWGTTGSFLGARAPPRI